MGADRHQSANEQFAAGLSAGANQRQGRQAGNPVRDKPSRDLPYRSGKVVSRLAQRLGRWEVRAKTAWQQGVWPRSGCCPMARGRPRVRSTSWRIAAISQRSPRARFTGGRGIPMHTIPSRSSSRRRSGSSWCRTPTVFTLRLRVGREPAAVLRRRHAPRDVLQRRGGLLPAETLRADAAGHRPRRSPWIGSASTSSPRNRAFGRFATAVSTKTAARRPAGISSAISSTTSRMCSCIGRRCEMAHTH